MKTKKLFTIFFISLAVFLTGCKQSRYITEYYIKNNIENHVPSEQSTLKTYSIYQGASRANKDVSSYIEFTGVKYNGMKKLIVGTATLAAKGNLFKNTAHLVQENTFVELDLTSCVGIISNYQELQDAIKQERPIPSEEIYHDFTASSDLFISFRKSLANPGIKTIDVWVAKNKYTLKTKKFIKKMKRFIDY